MKRLLVVVVLVWAPLFVLHGCAWFKPAARLAIDVALAACVAENALLNEPELRDVCHVVDEDLPIVRQLVAAHRRGVAKARDRVLVLPP